MMPEHFGAFLIEQRKKKGFTQKELAKKIGVSTGAVSKWERGLFLPELSRFEDIAKASEDYCAVLLGDVNTLLRGSDIIWINDI